MIVNKDSQYDVVVIGGGHSGYEACSVSARMGVKTLLLTSSIENLGQMSCNPAIGGIGKGHLVREIDGLDGLMAKIADKSANHYHCLNQKKGQAVWGPRVQTDRALYKSNMQQTLLNYPNLDIMFDMASKLIIKNDTIIGILTLNGIKVKCKKVIVTTGTFLNGTIHIGEEHYPAGRINENPSNDLAQSIKNIGFKTGRMQTCTPARIKSNSIDFSKMLIHPSDQNPVFMSFSTDKISIPQINCYITHTTKNIHDLIAKNIHRSATYNGDITACGPRYCPSIEDKIMRFPEKYAHQIFLESEGIDSGLIYPNGIFTGLAKDIQDQFIHMIPGMENCKIACYGYAIEYDCIHTSELQYSLETKKISGLYFAGQVNGSTGYEEAAAQGIIAGINASRSINNKEPFIPSRAECYIGVLIDDLITKGITEPYRMFTARSEYRLQLRIDNADQRMTNQGISLGCINLDRKIKFEEKIEQLNKLKNVLQNIKLSPQQCMKYNIKISKNGIVKSLFDLISHPDCNQEKIYHILPALLEYSSDVIDTVFAEAMYNTYILKQQDIILSLKKDENIKIPNDINYDNIFGLSYEARLRLKEIQPLNIAQANRVSGVTPVAILSLLSYIRRLKNHNLNMHQ